MGPMKREEGMTILFAGQHEQTAQLHDLQELRHSPPLGRGARPPRLHPHQRQLRHPGDAGRRIPQVRVKRTDTPTG